MNIKPLIKEIQDKINMHEAQITILTNLTSRIEPLTCRITAPDGFIDFDDPKRKDAIEIMLALGLGKWEKEPHWSGQTINYLHKGFSDKVVLRIYNTEPPGSCKVVKELVEVPAQPARVEERFTVKCQ